jgi:hypothetical protein
MTFVHDSSLHYVLAADGWTGAHDFPSAGSRCSAPAPAAAAAVDVHVVNHRHSLDVYRRTHRQRYRTHHFQSVEI